MLNEKAFRAIYNDYLESGLTVRDFCSNQIINESKFFYWQNKLKGLLPPKRGFVPVVFDSNQKELSGHLPVSFKDQPEPLINRPSPATTLTCEISYPNGISVKVNGLADLEMLRSLLVSTHR
jgi:hypothetical protein